MKIKLLGYHSYNNFTAPEDGYLFVVPVGFADCLPISFAGRAYNNNTHKWYMIAGRPCMDQTIFFTNEKDIHLGDEISFGSISQIAASSGDKTSPPEIQQNLKRIKIE